MREIAAVELSTDEARSATVALKTVRGHIRVAANLKSQTEEL